MSEQAKPTRPISEIQAEYQSLCTKAGHVQYQVDALKRDLGLLNQTLRDLNLEAAAAQQAAPKQEEPKPAESSEEAK